MSEVPQREMIEAPATTEEQRVLLIDDDVSLCRMLEHYLSTHGWEVCLAHRADTGLAAALAMKDGVVVLDVMLPDFDGLEMLRRLRLQSNVYVLLLTARGEEVDKILGLELGADDYLAKPFNPRELTARMRAILRRGPRNDAGASSLVISVADFRMDSAQRVITFLDQPVPLTDLEFQLLRLFLAHPMQVLSRESLVERALERPFHPLDRSLDMLVLRVRRKLENLAGFRGEIRTIRGSGYMLIPETTRER